MFEKLGVVKPWPNESDTGRERVTGNAADRMRFKVPSLCNVAKTVLYFHHGSVATLKEAVKLMVEYELGKDLTSAQVRSIVTWLGSLTGEIPQEYIRQPELPKSTAKTSKPDMPD